MDYLEYMRGRKDSATGPNFTRDDAAAMRWAVEEIERLRALRDRLTTALTRIEALHFALANAHDAANDSERIAREALANAREQKP